MLDEMSIDHYYHFATSLIRLHHAMRFLDLVEAEDSRWFDVESTSCSVRGDLAKRDVGEWEAWRTEHKASEECQVNPTRHLQQRVEISDRIETAQPPGETGAAAAPHHRQRVEHDRVAHQV